MLFIEGALPILDGWIKGNGASGQNGYALAKLWAEKMESWRKRQMTVSVVASDCLREAASALPFRATNRNVRDAYSLLKLVWRFQDELNFDVSAYYGKEERVDWYR